MDPRTLAVASDVAGGILTLLAILLWLKGEMFAGFGRWTLARTLAAVTTLVSLRSGTWPDWAVTAIVGAVVICDHILMLEACREFIGLRSRIRWVTIGGVCLFPVLVYTVAGLHRNGVFLLLMNLFGGAVFAACAWTLLANSRATGETGRLITGSCFAAQAIVYTVLAGSWVGHFKVVLAGPYQLNTLYLLFVTLWLIGINFGFFLMHYERLLAEREVQTTKAERSNRALEQLKDNLELTVNQRTGQLRESIDRQHENLSRLRKLSELSMLLGGDPSSVFERLVSIIGELFAVRAVRLSEIRGETLLTRAVYEYGRVSSSPEEYPLASSPCAGTLVTKDVCIYERVRELFPRASFLQKHDANACCAFPSINSAGQVVAVTCLIDDRPREFTEEDREILRVIGQRVAAEMERGNSMAERARMETVIRENERRLAEAQQMARLGSFTLDVTSGSMAWSEELYRIYELEAAEGSPSLDAVRTRMHPDDRTLFESTGENLRRGQQFSTEHRLVMSDGRIKHVMAQGVPGSDPGGGPIIRGTVQDITERKGAELEKAELEAQLYQAHKMESIGRLAGGVAHDFNNLLTVINGYSEFLIAELRDPALGYAKQIHKAGESAASLTRQLLAFSRMEITQPQQVHINQVVLEAKEMLQRLVGEHIKVKTALIASRDSVMADANQIHQCLMNLVVNARDAMPDGGHLIIGTSNIDVAPDDIPQGCGGAPGAHLCLIVRDSGTGMDEETRLRMFEPFFTTKEMNKGTGLGLSTVFGIVSQWGGFLKVKTSPGAGSEFSIYLPESVHLKSLDVAPRHEAPVPPVTRGTVLVVEDQDAVREYIVESLRLCGYEVLWAKNGAEAMDVIHLHGANIDLVVTDLLMPAMKGHELAARVTAVLPSLKVLIMTGYAEDMDCTGLRHEIIMKPFAPKELIGRIEALLHQGVLQ